MLKTLKNFYINLIKLVYHKGYAIEFNIENHPSFEEKKRFLNSIGTWLIKQDNMWLCTSKITNKEEFIKKFIRGTGISLDKFSIEERYYPFKLRY